MSRELDEFCDNVRVFIVRLDNLMKAPPSLDRGRDIAALTNKLQMSLDIFERYHKKDLIKRKSTKQP